MHFVEGETGHRQRWGWERGGVKTGSRGLGKCRGGWEERGGCVSVFPLPCHNIHPKGTVFLFVCHVGLRLDVFHYFV